MSDIDANSGLREKLATGKIESIEVEAVVIRKDGTREPPRIVGRYRSGLFHRVADLFTTIIRRFA